MHRTRLWTARDELRKAVKRALTNLLHKEAISENNPLLYSSAVNQRIHHLGLAARGVS